MENNTKNIIVKYLLNECNEQEYKEVKLLLESSTEYNSEFQAIKKLWDLGKDIPDFICKANIEEELQKFLTSIEQREKLNLKIAPIHKTRKLSFLKFGKIAASILIIFSLGALSLWWVISDRYNNSLNTNFAQEIFVPKGGKSIVVLPDGTKVWLNAGSKLKYTGTYGINSRNVDLEGEAYFSVKTNPHKPFIVSASGLKIKAFGTAFNVKAYPDEKTVSTTLEEGILKIEGKGINLTVKPKQNITYFKPEEQKNSTHKLAVTTQKIDSTKSIQNNIITRTDINTQVYTSWKDNKLIIESENLSEIAALLERKYDVSIEIKSDQLLQYKFRGSFQQETIEQIMDVLCLSAPIKYTIDKGIISIQPDKKRIENWNSLTN
jgi:transmembrane sensor